MYSLGSLQALSSLQTVRLDREKITSIGNLKVVRMIHSLYLQQNEIEKIEHLDVLSNLCFLTLARNAISNVENLTSLQRLQFLDLSYNQIERLEPDELPPSLLILHLTGNGCTKHKGYREQMVETLPLLQELDGQPVPGKGSEEQTVKSDGNSDSDDHDFTEASIPLNKDKGFFEFLHQVMWDRSARRRRDAQKEHEARMEELSDLLQPRNTSLSSLHPNPEQHQRPKKDLPVPNPGMSGVQGAVGIKFCKIKVLGIPNKPKSESSVAPECTSDPEPVRRTSEKAHTMRREIPLSKKVMPGKILPQPVKNIISSKTADPGLKK
ncbi:leucine-rich repeat-containing protein 46 isoform X2 [Microcaecilia unicolor]|uniref:Leucine-rich repeat-containing protein 46 isoform X2 n=1 Tax=Microcaecilia unicolor TaxID=1415580 RepID=A0A6P7ZH10_9AMPH|nr:leucine-rich repeat-containing protein 46 isoform X2 [Microcaecilia unicolor]